MNPARDLWTRIETIHAVTYFADESISAARDAGLRGFWMGYFAHRAAPLGRVSPGVVEALFANFSPAMVRRALPDAWDYAEPGGLTTSRARAAAAALRRVAPAVDEVAAGVNTALERIAAGADPLARPMFAANRDIEPPGDPVAQLWQHCTTLREHRGDGHVAALAGEEVDGCAAHLLIVADTGIPSEVLRDNRGWSVEDWSAARTRLTDRGLLDEAGLTPEGAALRRRVEDQTDRLALVPLARGAPGRRLEQLIEALDPVARDVSTSGVLPYPNPMGLPAL